MSVVAMRQEQPATENATFADFWLLYPRRQARKDAEKAWARLTEAERLEALVGLVTWRRIWIARDEMQFVPYPATWIRGERWTDEPPSDCVPRHASHVLAEVKETARGEMPAHVRDLLARMRGK